MAGYTGLLAAVLLAALVFFLALRPLRLKWAVACAGAVALAGIAALRAGARTDVLEPNLTAAAALAAVLAAGYAILRQLYPRLDRREQAIAVPLLSGACLLGTLAAAGGLWRTADWWLGLQGAPVVTTQAGFAEMIEGPRAAWVNGFLLAGRIEDPGGAGAVLIRTSCWVRGNVTGRYGQTPDLATTILPSQIRLVLEDGPTGLLPLPAQWRDYGVFPALSENSAEGCGMRQGDPVVIWYHEPAWATLNGTRLPYAQGPRLVETGITAQDFLAEVAPDLAAIARPFVAFAGFGAVLGLVQALMAVPQWRRLRRATEAPAPVVSPSSKPGRKRKP